MAARVTERTHSPDEPHHFTQPMMAAGIAARTHSADEPHRLTPPVTAAHAIGETNCIITCHNYGKYLRACLDSCLRQNVPFRRILVVNDASTDDTPRICRAYRDRGVMYLRGEWRDATIAQNIGVEHLPRSSYVVFVDADNILAADFHQQLLRAMKEPNIGAVYPSIQQFDARGFIGPNRFVKPYDYHAQRLDNMADTCSLIRREAFDQINGIMDNRWGMTDWLFFLRMTAYGWRLVHQPHATLFYRLHDSNMHLQRKDIHERHIGPLQKGCMVAVVTLFCGRAKMLPVHKRWVRALDWPRENLHFVAIDNSRNKAFGRRLRSHLTSLGCAYTYHADERSAAPAVPSRQLADERALRSRNAYQMNIHIARLYAVARQRVPSAADFIWCVEDDIEPPPNTLERFFIALYKHQQAGVVCGAARSRYEDRYVLWKNGQPLRQLPPNGEFLPIDASGFFCTIFRRQVWDKIAFRPTRDWTTSNCAYDWAAASDIHRWGWQWLLAGNVVCKHWQPDGTWV